MSEETHQEAADLRAENQWLWGEVTRFSQWQARTERLRASTYEMLVRAQGEANAAEAERDKYRQWHEEARQEAADLRAENQRLMRERDRLAGIVERVKALFAGGPDTPCRTTYTGGVECVEVPMADLRAAMSGGGEA